VALSLSVDANALHRLCSVRVIAGEQEEWVVETQDLIVSWLIVIIATRNFINKIILLEMARGTIVPVYVLLEIQQRRAVKRERQAKMSHVTFAGQ